MAKKVNHPERPATRKKRLNLRFDDCGAVRLLMRKPMRWRYADLPRAAAVDGGTDDPRWRFLRWQQYASRERKLVLKLAAEFHIKEGSADFWELLCFCVLGLFPAFQIRKETRGRRMDPERASRLDKLARSPGKQMANVEAVAAERGEKAATWARALSAHKKRRLK